MLTKQDCLDDLRQLISEAKEIGFGQAQNLLLRFALSHDGQERRAAAIDDILTDLSRGDQAGGESSAQQAFRSALLEMIERTKLMVGPNRRELQV